MYCAQAMCLVKCAKLLNELSMMQIGSYLRHLRVLLSDTQLMPFVILISFVVNCRSMWIFLQVCVSACSGNDMPDNIYCSSQPSLSMWSTTGSCRDSCKLQCCSSQSGAYTSEVCSYTFLVLSLF
jgi:hypothetical protein